MGLLSEMASLFHIHIDTEKKEQIRQEVNLSEAVEAHISWKLRLHAYLEGKSQEKLDPMVICRDDQCKLGQWIHGAALNHFHGAESFHQLRADHAQFHYLAGSVVQKVHANEHAEAEAILKGDYQRISHRVVIALTELNNLVAE